MRIVVAFVLISLALFGQAQTMRTLWLKREVLNWPDSNPRAVRCAPFANGDTVMAVEDSRRLPFLRCYGPDGTTRWHKVLWTDSTSSLQFRRLVPAPDGDMYVVGTLGSTTTQMLHILVTKVAPSGASRWSKRIALATPAKAVAEDAKVGPNGDLYISGAEGLQGVLFRVSPTGVVVSSKVIGNQIAQAGVGQIEFDSNGNVVAAVYSEGQEDSITLFSPALTTIRSFSFGEDRIGTFAIDKTGAYGVCGLYTEDSLFAGAFVSRYTPEGVQLWRNGYPSRQGFPWMAVDSQGHYVVLNRNEASVSRFDTSGTLLSQVSYQIPNTYMAYLTNFLDRYGRHYFVGGGFNLNEDYMRVFAVRGDRWTGIDSKYIYRSSLDFDMMAADAYIDRDSGDIVYVGNDFDPIVGRIAQAPEAVADRFTVPAGQTFSSPYGLTYNDRFARSAVVSIVRNPSNGSLTLGPGDKFEYTPNPSFTGADSFSYEVRKPGLNPSRAEVSLTIQ